MTLKIILSYVASLMALIAVYVGVIFLALAIVDDALLRVVTLLAISIIFVIAMASTRLILRRL